MNQYVKITKKDWGYYSAMEYSTWIMYLIANFFIQDVNDDINYCMKRLDEKNNALFCVGGDWAFLEKDENDYIVMIDTTTWRNYEDKSIPEDMILRIKPSELIKLLYRWEDLYAKKVPEIMITKDGDTFEMFAVKQ